MRRVDSSTVDCDFPFQLMPVDDFQPPSAEPLQRRRLDAAFRSGDRRRILACLKQLAQDHGMSRLARDVATNMDGPGPSATRKNLYVHLADDGDPRLSMLLPILDALGYRLTPVEKPKPILSSERPRNYAGSLAEHLDDQDDD